MPFPTHIVAAGGYVFDNAGNIQCTVFNDKRRMGEEEGCQVMRVTHLIYKANRALWRITKPVTIGVRAILIKDNKVLLVKHTYQDHWYLPGGRMKKGETFEQAIRRELAEELGAELGDLKLFGVYNNFYEYKNDSIVIFLSDDFTFTGKSDNEIERYSYFDLHSLPDKVSPGTSRRIKEYLEGKFRNFGIW